LRHLLRAGISRFNFKFVAALIFFSVCFSLPTLHGETITYRRVIKEAIDNSARVKIKEIDIKIYESVFKQHRSSLYPKFTLNSRMEKLDILNEDEATTSIFGQVIGGEQDEWRTTSYFMGEYPLSNWYKNWHEIGYYEDLQGVAVLECDVEIKTILKEVTDIYRVIKEAKIKFSYSEDILSRLLKVSSLVKRAYEAGERSYEDFLQVERELLAIEKERVDIFRALDENLIKLSVYTGNRYRYDVDLEEVNPEEGLSLNNLNVNPNHTPEYMVGQKSLEALRRRVRGVKRNFWPDLVLYGRYDYYGNDPEYPNKSIDDLEDRSFSAGVSLSIPLFDGGEKKWARAQVYQEMKKEEEKARLTLVEKSREIDNLMLSYSAYLKSLEYYKNLSERYKELTHISKRSHELGERGMIDVLNTEKEALTVERDMKVIENSIAFIEKVIFLEANYGVFIDELYGNRVCKY